MHGNNGLLAKTLKKFPNPPKHNLFPMHLKNHLKTSNLSEDNLKKIVDLDESILEPVMRAADLGQRISCFNIDYNLDVQYQVAPGLPN